MFLHIFKKSLSSLALFVIAIIFFLVHFISNQTQLSLLIFFLYFFVFIFGIGLTRQTLLLYFPDLTVAITILVLAFGTNLFCIVSLDYQIQPIILFSLYAMVLFFTAKWHINQKMILVILLAITIGLIFLFQPTGFLALLIPILWGVHDKTSWKLKVQLIKSHYYHLFVFFGCLAIFTFIPIQIWKISPGEIPLFSLKLPGVFYSFSSFLWDDLFSFEHGLFIYTPLMVVPLIGFYFFSEKYRPLFYAIFLFCFLDLIFETSWSLLGTTPVFGQIAFIPAYALLVFPIAAFIGLVQKGNNMTRIILSVPIIFIILLNIFQTWQMNEGIMLKSGINADKYGKIFGRISLTDIKKQELVGIDVDTIFVLKDESRFRKEKLAFYDFEDQNVPYKSKLEGNFVNSGKLAFTLDTSTQFSPAFEISYDEFTKRPRVGLRITVSVFALDTAFFSDINLVISSLHEKINYRYKRLNLGKLKLKSGKWNTVSFDYLIPKDPYPSDRLVAYVWYPGKARIYIDDLKYEAFESK